MINLSLFNKNLLAYFSCKPTLNQLIEKLKKRYIGK